MKTLKWPIFISTTTKNWYLSRIWVLTSRICLYKEKKNRICLYKWTLMQLHIFSNNFPWFIMYFVLFQWTLYQYYKNINELLYYPCSSLCPYYLEHLHQINENTISSTSLFLLLCETICLEKLSIMLKLTRFYSQ
jgi:hypothetical protein